mmetsp:Transcript_3479/g.9766  ORF Transcript_3479/g.9766 Transcript_3479/m.9766 type:complete len:117 (-) Transcript_3479:704-1054(-)
MLGWPWFVKVDQEKRERVRKKCQQNLSAYVNCTRAYQGGGSNTGNKACENLRNQVLHCWAKGYCEDAVAGYERCYHLAVNRGNLGVHAKTGQLACVREAKNMEKCLKRQRVLPKEL